MSVLEKSTFAKMFEAAELCRERALDIPMLVLVYTAMDTLAWALYGDKIQGGAIGSRRYVTTTFFQAAEFNVLRWSSMQQDAPFSILLDGSPI